MLLFVLTFPNGGLLRALMQVWELFQFAHSVVISCRHIQNWNVININPRIDVKLPSVDFFLGGLVHQKVMPIASLKLGDLEGQESCMNKLLAIMSVQLTFSSDMETCHWSGY